MRSKANRCGGFTLVELSVTAAITGVLLTLAVPALQAVRSAAQRNACAQHLIRLQAAMHRHEAAHGVFPAGVRDDTGGPILQQAAGLHQSWTIELLPYVDQQAAHANIARDVSVYGQANAPVRRLPIAVFRCPLESAAFPPRSSYAGVHHDRESPIDVTNHGLLYLNSRIGYDDVPDGLAYTLLLGEKRGDENDLGWMSGTRATLRNTGVPLNFSTRRGAPSRSPPASTMYVGGFGSRHTGGAHFAYADGRVQFLSDSINAQTLRALAHRADGRPADTTPP
jgi:prepilin-type N-terminal cleavage/methylation domain-containing protein/prepilin-type processing-associated H-X9-DG protein